MEKVLLKFFSWGIVVFELLAWYATISFEESFQCMVALTIYSDHSSLQVFLYTVLMCVKCGFDLVEAGY